jgi:pyrroloquinoline quinone biosynthesis protein D
MTVRHERLPRRQGAVAAPGASARSLLVGSESQVVHELNATAAAVWELCDGRTSLAEVTEAVCQVFSVSAEKAARDVEAAVDQLIAAGLVVLDLPAEEVGDGSH